MHLSGSCTAGPSGGSRRRVSWRSVWQPRRRRRRRGDDTGQCRDWRRSGGWDGTGSAGREISPETAALWAGSIIMKLFNLKFQDSHVPYGVGLFLRGVVGGGLPPPLWPGTCGLGLGSPVRRTGLGRSGHAHDLSGEQHMLGMARQARGRADRLHSTEGMALVMISLIRLLQEGY